MVEPEVEERMNWTATKSIEEGALIEDGVASLGCSGLIMTALDPFLEWPRP